MTPESDYVVESRLPYSTPANSAIRVAEEAIAPLRRISSSRINPPLFSYDGRYISKYIGIYRALRGMRTG